MTELRIYSRDASFLDAANLKAHLQQVLEVDVLLVRHILQTVLAVDLGTCFMEMAAHRKVDRVPGKTGRLALVALLILHPGDEDDLQDDYTTENAPNSQYTLKRVDLERQC
jgi:hypothetical protein